MSDSVPFQAIGKIYLLTVGYADDFEAVGVASTPKRAKKFMDQFPDEEWNKPREMIIDDLMEIPKGKYPYYVRVYKNPEYEPEADKWFDRICIYIAERIRDNQIEKDTQGNFLIYVWAKDKKEAKKLALELLKFEKESEK